YPHRPLRPPTSTLCPYATLFRSILPMRQSGVEVRPLRQMLGGAEFNEVFLDGAYVPDELLVGPLRGGWKVAMSTLGYERAAIARSEEHTSELQSRENLVCRLLLE